VAFVIGEGVSSTNDMPMLTPEDLQAIQTALKPQFDAIGTMVDGVETSLVSRIDELEETMNIKFEAVHEHFTEEIGQIRNEMVTKDYLDRKLTEYVKKPA
jgi:hypothetical protein